MGKSKISQSTEDVKREHPLQAVVFADSFKQTFRPISLECPKVLMPLVNVPMLEYTIEFLSSSGVEEVIVFCISHAEEVERFLSTSYCSKTVSVRCITSNTCLSAGDAIRELDRMNVIRSDPFILITGDVVSNMNLKQVISEHKERKNKDPSSIMTIVFKKAHSNHPTRSLVGDLVVVVDSKTDQLLLYDEEESDASTNLSNVFLKEHKSVQFRNDLLDCHIDICSPDVLVQFSDNFDYQDIRHDFVHNEVQNYELGHKIHAKVISKDYAARVHDPRTYQAICQDIIHRWTYPLVPDNNFLGNTSYSYSRLGIYKEKSVALSRSCSLVEDTVIGSGTSLDENCMVTKSTIGRNCQIGKNVRIENSIIWNGVSIEDNVCITGSIICDGVVIKTGAIIEVGCILSFGIVIGSYFRVTEHTKLTTQLRTGRNSSGFLSNTDDISKSVANQSWDKLEVGVSGIGRKWSITDEDEEFLFDESIDESSDSEICKASIECLLKKTLIGCKDIQIECSKAREKWEPLYSSDEEFEETFSADVDPTFEDIVCDTVQSGDIAGEQLDNIFLEIKGVRFAQNRTFADCLKVIVPALLGLVDKRTDSKDSSQLISNLRQKFIKWKIVIGQCIMNEDDEMILLTSLEAYATSSDREYSYFPYFRCLLQTVYDLDLVSEDVILQWHSDRMLLPLENPSRQLVEYKHIQEFVAWLEQDDSESDESD